MKRHAIRSILTLLMASWATAAEPATSSPSDTAAALATPMSEQARTYLSHALDVLELSSINRQKIAWPKFREQAIERARGAQLPADTYPAIRYALEQLGDHHSLFLTPEAKTQWVAPIAPLPKTSIEPAPASPGSSLTASPPAPPAPHGQMLGDIAYITVPGFLSGNEEGGVAFADAALQTISQLEAKNPRGWIVDLREDTGGNMWPMLVGLGPLTGDGDVGSVVAPYGVKTSWWYRDGSAGSGRYTVAKASAPVPKLHQPTPPVALLTGSQTASAGEAIVVSFLGRPATRMFGQGTNGRSTSNDKFNLSDGAILFITIGVFADRTGKTYGDVIPPDVEVAAATGPAVMLAEDPVVRAASAWLRKSAL